jgi:hypothetical protein
VSAVRVAVRASRIERSAWQAELIARLRAIPGVEVVETYEARLLLPADLFIDPSEGPLAAIESLHPRLGVWRFVYGPEGRLIDPCLREHEAGERGAMVRLVSIARDGSATALETGVFKTVIHSLGATRARICTSIVEWPERALRRSLADPLHVTRGPRVAIEASAQSNPSRPDHSHRGPADALRGLGRRVAQEMIEEHWRLGVIHKPVHHVIESFDPNEIQWLAMPEGLVLADPAGGVERDGRLILLAEAYDFKDRQGRIVALELQGDRLVARPGEVLRLAVHASYPHLIEHEGRIYCLPEASATGCVQLFRAEPFPDRWVPDRILLQSFAGADATVHRYGGRWWMFTGNHDDQDETKLYVFHASDLFGPWQPHAWNPVKTDLRSARPAGPLFEHNGALYRPAQDGSRTYGGAVTLNRIVALSPTEFAEETVNVLRPAPAGPCPDGLHTLTGVGGVTLVDGKRHARSFKRLAWGLKQLALGGGAKRQPASVPPPARDPARKHGSPQPR